MQYKYTDPVYYNNIQAKRDKRIALYCNIRYLGRFPIQIVTMKRCMKYWLRILTLPEDRYVKLCYNMLLLHDSHGYENWAPYVRKNLYSNVFGYVLQAQKVENETLFLSEYSSRMQINIYNMVRFMQKQKQAKHILYLYKNHHLVLKII